MNVLQLTHTQSRTASQLLLSPAGCSVASCLGEEFDGSASSKGRTPAGRQLHVPTYTRVSSIAPVQSS